MLLYLVLVIEMAEDELIFEEVMAIFEEIMPTKNPHNCIDIRDVGGESTDYGWIEWVEFEIFTDLTKLWVRLENGSGGSEIAVRVANRAPEAGEDKPIYHSVYKGPLTKESVHKAMCRIVGSMIVPLSDYILYHRKKDERRRKGCRERTFALERSMKEHDEMREMSIIEKCEKRGHRFKAYRGDKIRCEDCGLVESKVIDNLKKGKEDCPNCGKRLVEEHDLDEGYVRGRWCENCDYKEGDVQSLNLNRSMEFNLTMTNEKTGVD